jgi:riboflavin synthase
LFTGLIREIGEVVNSDKNILKVKSSLKPKLGDSIAINGVCLTVISLWKEGFWVETADETRAIIPKEKLLGKVHLEPAMKIEDRFEGHIVQGHIDAIGKIKNISKGENGVAFEILVDDSKMTYIVPKGSIAIDGVSLTVNWSQKNSFGVTIIPHTFENTLFHTYKIGTLLNIETDLFARYIEHILFSKKAQQKNKNLSWKEIDFISLSF